MDFLHFYVVSVLKIVGTAGVSWLVLGLLGIPASEMKGGIVMALSFWGAVMVFFGEHMQGKNFWAGHRGGVRWVDTATPRSVWVFAGGVLWFIALLCLMFLR